MSFLSKQKHICPELESSTKKQQRITQLEGPCEDDHEIEPGFPYSSLINKAIRRSKENEGHPRLILTLKTKAQRKYFR